MDDEKDCSYYIFFPRLETDQTIRSTNQHTDSAATYNEAVGYEYKVPAKRLIG